MAELYRGQQQRWQQIRSALAYPLILLILSLALSLLMLKGIWGNLRELIEFDSIEMPVAVHRLNWLEDTGWKYALLLVGVPLLLAVVVRLVGGSWYWTWALSRLPGFGKLILWSGYVEFLSLLRAMLANDVSLPVALRSAALGVRNPVVARSAMQCAERIEQGQSFATSLAAENDIPATLAYLVQWGEANSSLPESLEMATETLESQIRWRVDLLRSVLPPLLFIVTATFAVGMFYLAIAPMQAYLSWLSI
jgi:type II secretory pathway component PulF